MIDDLDQRIDLFGFESLETDLLYKLHILPGFKKRKIVPALNVFKKPEPPSLRRSRHVFASVNPVK